MDMIVIIVSALVFLFSAWFYNVSDNGFGEGSDTITIEEKKNNKNNEKVKDEVVVNYYTSSENDENIKSSKFDNSQIENLVKNTTKTAVQQSKPTINSNERIMQTQFAQPSLASVVNPQSKSNSVTSSQTPQQQNVHQPTQQNTHFQNKFSSGSNSFSVVTPPSIPQVSGMDAPPEIPTLTSVSNEIATTDTSNNTKQTQQQTTSSQTKLEGPPQIGQ